MKARTWKAILATTLAAMMTLSVSWNARANQERDYEIQGTWLVTVSQQPCGAGADKAVEFQSILTFADGGTMSEDTANKAFEPGQRGAGQGSWSYEGKHTFSAKSVALIKWDTTKTPKTPLSAPIFQKGTQIITQTITFQPGDPNAWSSKATVEFLNSAGPYSPSQIVPPPCIDTTATAVRFE
jgi:hypothetical protein